MRWSVLCALCSALASEEVCTPCELEAPLDHAGGLRQSPTNSPTNAVLRHFQTPTLISTPPTLLTRSCCTPATRTIKASALSHHAAGGVEQLSKLRSHHTMLTSAVATAARSVRLSTAAAATSRGAAGLVASMSTNAANLKVCAPSPGRAPSSQILRCRPPAPRSHRPLDADA